MKSFWNGIMVLVSSLICTKKEKKLYCIIKYYLTLHHRRDTVVLDIERIRFFHEGNELFVLGRLGEGNVKFYWSGGRSRVDTVLNSIARRFKRIDEDEVSDIPICIHIVRPVEWLRTHGISQTQLRNG